MNLIEIYIQEVTRRLPEKSREDIALELRSTIEDMLPDDYDEEDVKLVLEKLGNPVTLASGYRDQPMHLIGPRYFDVYVSLLKMIVPIAAVISLISMVDEFLIGYDGAESVTNIVLTIVGGGIWTIIEVGIQTFFWLTLVFAIIERVDTGQDQQPLTTSLSKWTPDDLRNIPHIPKKKMIAKFEVFGSLMWTAIWATVYFYANRLLGVYRGGDNGLEFMAPAFNQDVLLSYWPIILVVIVCEIAMAIYKLIKGQWTKTMAICNAVLQLVTTVVFTVIFLSPNIMNENFIIYMKDVFIISVKQFEVWFLGGVIIIFIISAAISVFDGFRKARI
ncbi:HAAS signaling domain-containing protein [Bacillus sp. Hm123]|uniref:HAAS signaling domain-containing protein n=1 Tax=Bacillus sp. Hm123 TaxID=3450745 RepID=UPI003F442166